MIAVSNSERDDVKRVFWFSRKRSGSERERDGDPSGGTLEAMEGAKEAAHTPKRDTNDSGEQNNKHSPKQRMSQ